MSGDPGPDQILAAAVRLRVDAITAEIVCRMREAALRPILLKGPSIAEWLYDDPSSRPYTDTDLLLPPDQLKDAQKVLGDLRFRAQPPTATSAAWHRDTDVESTGLPDVVDLHTTLFGVRVTRHDAWRVLSRRTETISVGKAAVPIEVLARPSRLLNVALHAAQHGGDGFARPLIDLRRALEREPAASWDQAAALAVRLEAEDAFVAGLSREPEGARTARRMQGFPARSRLVDLHMEGGPPFALTLEWLAATPGIGAKLSLLRRRAFPAREYMRRRYPSLASSRLGLLCAYLWRAASIAPHVPRAIRERQRARGSRESAGSRAGGEPHAK